MADVLRFVDSVSASATTRLDLNDDTAVLHVREVQWNPPRLRRSVSQNMLRDGGHVGPSSYDLRTLVLSFDVIASDVDTLATHLQALTRELDRETNWLMYQPTGATHPVFFKTYRSDVGGFTEFPAAVAFRQLTVEVVTDPFALGLLESVSVGTVSNDPAAGSNGCYFDVTTVKGDVAAPMVLTNANTVNPHAILSVKSAGTPANSVVAIQAEAMTAGTDTALTGSTDSAMSGSGNNYQITNFSTAASSTDPRLSYTFSGSGLAELSGLFRVIAVVKRSGGTDDINVFAMIGGAGEWVSTAPVATVADTTRRVVDLGLVAADANALASATPTVAVGATRSGSTDSLYWDYIQLFPADESMVIVSSTSLADQVFDGINGDIVYHVTDEADLFSGGATRSPATVDVSGKLPVVRPGVTNRFHLVTYSTLFGSGIVKTNTADITIYYYPRYTTVRPVAT